jgi:hypothetical protein
MKRLFMIPVAFILAFGCDAKDEIEAEIDCRSICQRYSDCFDDDYDVSACQDRCEDDIDQGELEQSDVDECDNCIDEASCAGDALSCATQCVGIVP